MENCPKCGMQRRTAGPGSITQWIATCQCDRLVPDTPNASVNEQVLLCTDCNKRISTGRVGSLTQWVFRSDICACEKPNPVVSQLPESENLAGTQDNTDSFINDDFVGHGPIDENITVDLENFPTHRYRALSEVGRGASGIVYRAVDRMLQKEIAIKCLRSVTGNELMSFQKEAQATSRLNHPNIIKIYDFGASPGGAPYMVMEFLSGISLKRLLDRNGPLPEAEAVAIFIDLTRALVHAHSKGIFHRDIKSSNVIINSVATDAHTVRLIDFGVASLKGVESPNGMNTILVGTPPYMAPDQLAGKPFDARSEIYSLGCLFYETLTGNPPFVGETALETMNMHATCELLPLSEAYPEGHFSEEMEYLVSRCLEKSPENRFQSMQDLALHIESCSTFLVSPALEVESGLDTESGVKGYGLSGVSKSTLFAFIIGLGVIGIAVGAFLYNRLAPFGSHETPSIKLQPVNAKLYPKQSTDWVRDAVENEEIFVRGDRAAITFGNDQSLEKLSNRPEIKYLRLNRCVITGAGAAKILAMKLLNLQLDGTKLDTAAYATLGRMSTLRQLLITNSGWFTGEMLQSFEKIPLTEINLTGCDVRDDAMVYLKSQNRLEILTIAQNSQFTGAGLAELSGCSKLHNLILLDLPKFSDQSLEYVARMPQLVGLILTDNNFVAGRSKDDLAAAMGAPRVARYDLEAFKNLSAMKRLTVLSLDADRLSDSHFDAIEKIPRLTNLSLSGRNFINPGNIEKLSRIPTLRVLKIIGPCLESEGIRRLCALPNIQRLVLADCELTNSSLAEFSKSQVVQLVIDGENTISGVGLDFLAKMPNLQMLKMPAVSYITPVESARFLAKKPGCKFEEKK